MTRRQPQPIPDQEALEDQLLLDLFRRPHATGRDMKRLTDYTSENELRVLAHLTKHGDTVFVGDGQVILTHPGARRITDKYPELKD